MVGTQQSALVEQAQTGDQRAFTTLLRDHDDKMRGLAFQLLGNQTAMDDALQDAYLKAYTSLPRFRQDAAFGTWLYRIVYTTCIDHLRRRSRRREVGLQAVRDLPTSEDQAQRLATQDQVTRALTTLSTDHKAALILIDREGLSYDEASLILDIPAGTIASRLNRARTAFRAALTTNEGPADR